MDTPFGLIPFKIISLSQQSKTRSPIPLAFKALFQTGHLRLKAKTPNMAQKAALENLPPELILRIYTSLPIKDVTRMRRVSHRFDDLYQTNRHTFISRAIDEELRPSNELLALYEEMQHGIRRGYLNDLTYGCWACRPKQRKKSGPRRIPTSTSGAPGEEKLLFNNAGREGIFKLCLQVCEWKRLFAEFAFPADSRRSLTATEGKRLEHAFARVALYDLLFHAEKPVVYERERMPVPFSSEHERLRFLRRFSTAELMEMRDLLAVKLEVVRTKLCPSLEDKWEDDDNDVGSTGGLCLPSPSSLHRRRDPTAWFSRSSPRREDIVHTYAKLTPMDILGIMDTNPQAQRPVTRSLAGKLIPDLPSDLESLSAALTAVLDERAIAELYTGPAGRPHDHIQTLLRRLMQHRVAVRPFSTVGTSTQQRNDCCAFQQHWRRQKYVAAPDAVPVPPPRCGGILDCCNVRVPKRYRSDACPVGRQHIPPWYGRETAKHAQALAIRTSGCLDDSSSTVDGTGDVKAWITLYVALSAEPWRNREFLSLPGDDGAGEDDE